VTASVSVCSPKRKFGEIETFHWWEFGAEGEVLKITSGGWYCHPQTGSDSFTSMIWGAAPVPQPEFSDFSASLSMVPDLRSFPEGVESIDFTVGEYEIEILDNDNPLLDEDGDEKDGNQDDVEGSEEEEVVDGDQEAGEGISEPWSITTVDASEECEFSAELRVLSASLASRDGWLILGGFAVKGAWVGEAGWLVDSNGPGTTFSACRFAHFLSLFLAGMGTESFCRRYSITAHPTSAETMAIEKFVPVKISLKANLILFPLPLVLVNSPIRRFE
jgi:hypothetical protein